MKNKSTENGKAMKVQQYNVNNIPSKWHILRSCYSLNTDSEYHILFTYLYLVSFRLCDTVQQHGYPNSNVGNVFLSKRYVGCVHETDVIFQVNSTNMCIARAAHLCAHIPNQTANVYLPSEIPFKRGGRSVISVMNLRMLPHGTRAIETLVCCVVVVFTNELSNK